MELTTEKAYTVAAGARNNLFPFRKMKTTILILLMPAACASRKPLICGGPATVPCPGAALHKLLPRVHEPYNANVAHPPAIKCGIKRCVARLG